MRIKTFTLLSLSLMFLSLGTLKVYGQQEKKYNLTYTADGSINLQSFTVCTTKPGTLVKVEFPDGQVAEAISSEKESMTKFAHRITNTPKPWVIKITTEGVQSFASSLTGITNIDLSACPEIKRLIVPNENIESLNLKGLTNLEQLFVYGNEKIKTLDISDLKNLLFLNISNNPDLKLKGIENCLKLQYLIAYNSSFSNPDVSNFKDLIHLDLTNTKTSTINLTNNRKLLKLELTDNLLTKVDLTMLDNLEVLKIARNQLEELNLENNQKLTELDLSENKLSKLNIASENITSFECNKNNLPLSQLPPKGSMNVYIYWPQNAFPIQKKVEVNKVLDLSAEIKATDPVGKIKNTNFFLYTKDNTPLEEGIDYINKDGKFSFLKTFDQPLRFKLMNAAFPKLKGKYAMFSDWFNVVSSENIEDQQQKSVINITTTAKAGEYIMLSIDADGELEVTGAELKYGGMAEVKDAHITIKGQIKGIDCTEAQLTSLDLSQAPNITTIICNNNSLEKLETSNLKELKILSCAKNKIKELSVKNNLKLEELDCSENNLNTLDITNNSALKLLLVFHNQLTEINIKKNLFLKGLDMSENKLSKLDVTANTKLETIYCNGNNINGQEMEALVTSLPNRKDRTEPCHFFGIDTKNVNEKNVIYNPQVKIANDKNWQVLDYSAGDNDGNGVEYGGTSGIERNKSITSASLKIENDVLYIFNLAPQSCVKVYSLSGELLGMQKVKTGSVVFNIGNQAVVVAMINGRAYKISK